MKLFAWYSICSMHGERRNKDCRMCQAGSWMFDPWVRFKAARFRRTHRNVNGVWVKKP